MLIGKEEHPPPAGERPLEDRAGVGRSADDAAAAAAKRLQIGRRVHIRDRSDFLDVDRLRQLRPAVFDVFDRGHVGHRAAGGKIGKDDGDALSAAGGELFRAVGEDVGRFRHKVDAAEDDRAALGVGGRQRAELVAVAAEVRQGDDVVLLVVMAEDQEPSAQIAADFLDARVSSSRSRDL